MTTLRMADDIAGVLCFGVGANHRIHIGIVVRTDIPARGNLLRDGIGDLDSSWFHLT